MKEFLKKILPARLWIYLKQCKRASVLAVRTMMEGLGLNVVRKSDYYSPLPVVSQLQRNLNRWYKPSNLVGISFDLEEFKSLTRDLLAKYLDEFLQVSRYQEVSQTGFGPGYPAVDALMLYLMVRERKPRLYLEVGSGVSTYYCSLAAKQNAAEGYPLQIECIEPYPFEKLSSIPDITVHAKEVQDCDLSLFQRLQENDLLFIDSSHIVKIDGDIPFIYLELLPRLKKGVIVHIHDVPFPFNIPYPPSLWIFEQNWPVFWNEAMMLQAFLCFNNKYKIIQSLPLLRYYDEAFLKKNVPIYESMESNPNTFSSIWLEKVD